MNDRGYEKLRLGRKKITTYAISKQSRVLKVLEDGIYGEGGFRNDIYNRVEPWLCPPDKERL